MKQTDTLPIPCPGARHDRGVPKRHASTHHFVCEAATGQPTQCSSNQLKCWGICGLHNADTEIDIYVDDRMPGCIDAILNSTQFTHVIPEHSVYMTSWIGTKNNAAIEACAGKTDMHVAGIMSVIPWYLAFVSHHGFGRGRSVA